MGKRSVNCKNSLQALLSPTCSGFSPPTSPYLSWLGFWVEYQRVGHAIPHGIKSHIAAGNVSLSTAIVTDVSTPSTRGRGMAMIGVAFSLGFLIGPMIGAAFSLWGKEAGGEWWEIVLFLKIVHLGTDVFIYQLLFIYPWFKKVLYNVPLRYVYPALFAFGLSIIDIIFLSIFFKVNCIDHLLMIVFFAQESLPEQKRSATSLVATAKSYIHPLHLFRFGTFSAFQTTHLFGLCQFFCLNSDLQILFNWGSWDERAF